MLTLLRHPDQLGLLRNDPQLMAQAVEECMRFETPVRIVAPYTAAIDVRLGDTLVRRGERVQVWLAAANRDPAVFDDPDRFDITRTQNRHMTFSSGIHFCLGAALARLETQAALQGLTDLPGIELVDPVPRWRATWGLRSLETLPVRWDPDPAPT